MPERYPDPTLRRIDRAVTRAAKAPDLLHYLTPINLESERRRFLKKQGTRNPAFSYRLPELDPIVQKRTLHRIPLEEIADSEIQQLYVDVVQDCSNRLDLLQSLGTERFLYDSLRYFGRPGRQELKDAEFLLHGAPLTADEQEETLPLVDTARIFEDTARDHGFSCSIEYTDRLVSKALAGPRGLRIRKNVRFSAQETRALAHHEIGVHYLTTLNARRQPLCVLQIGLPVNTITQEGLGVLSEYLSGNLTLQRLREIALRVIAVHEVVEGTEFRHTFQRLVEQYEIDPERAFDVTVRAYRGRGFTKDYVYLRGFRTMLLRFQSGQTLDALLIGKTHHDYQPVLERMIAKRLLHPPAFQTVAFAKPAAPDPILAYLVRSLR